LSVQADDGIRDRNVTGVQTCALPICLAQGLSLAELAARAHLSQSTLSRIENGQRRLALDQLVTLARALDTGLDELVEEQEERVVSNAEVDHGPDSLRWRVRHGPGAVILPPRVTGPPPHPLR